MYSIFFQISNLDFIEASKLIDQNGLYGNRFAVRLISYQDGVPRYIYLKEMTRYELGTLASLLGATLLPDYRALSDVRNYVTVDYYY